MRKKLGDILLEAGVITQEQLENGLNVQKGKNKRFGKVMVELGYVDEFQVAETHAQQLSLPLVDCNANPISPEVLSLVPREIAEETIVLPLRVEEKRLILAMADPLDWQTIDENARWSASLSLNVPVFDGLFSKGRIREARARTDGCRGDS